VGRSTIFQYESFLVTLPPRHSEVATDQHRARVIRRLRQRAANLGFTLVDHEPGEVLEGAVS
jgi:hypothetical protein